jgi:MoxR-like ATPase
MTEPATNTAWFVYHGDGRTPHSDWILPPAPPWRVFYGQVPDEEPESTSVESRLTANRRLLGASSYRLDSTVAELVNAALLLRRPLLVTGGPGSGKSSLAYSIAYELGLGDVLYWPITSRSSLTDGLYSYDAIGRLQETSLRQAARDQGNDNDPRPSIGDYVRLGPLGTALVPRRTPRVLLIDEIDKSDIDLPNDLLSVLELGEFTIDELDRLPDSEEPEPVSVMTADSGRRAPIVRGMVRCADFPVIVLTSNGERPFPQAFLRRCIPIELKRPDNAASLTHIVESHFAAAPEEESEEYAAFREERDTLIDRYLDAQANGHAVAVDQLLNALYLATAGARATGADFDGIRTALLRPLNLADR